MKTIAEMIAVMQAYEDGKEIEYYSEVCSEWKKATTPAWNWYTTDYRVKPEPEYIPFTFEDAEFLIGKVVKHKTDNHLVVVTWCSNETTSVASYKRLLCDYTFLDGSPCGKLKSK